MNCISNLNVEGNAEAEMNRELKGERISCDLKYSATETYGKFTLETIQITFSNRHSNTVNEFRMLRKAHRSWANLTKRETLNYIIPRRWLLGE